MSHSEENPFAPPASSEQAFLANVGAVPSGSAAVNSVSFRISLDDLKRGQSSIQSSFVTVLGLVLLLVTVGITLRSLPIVFRFGLTTETIPILLPAIVVMVVVVAVLGRRWGKGSSESPFETTVTLTPSELVIREERLAELRRSWAGVGPVFLNRTTLRFDFQMYDLSQGRFMMQPGQIVPLRAFESEADASSFLTTARQYIESADRSQLPGAVRLKTEPHGG